ncbi:uncharacterized protein LOC144650142 [Oculina patagonica]
MIDAWTQCEFPKPCDAHCQFPEDVCKDALADHSYSNSAALPTFKDLKQNVSQGSQTVLVAEHSEDQALPRDIIDKDENMEEGEPMEIVLSQGSLLSQTSEFVPSNGSESQDEEYPSSQDSINETGHTGFKQRVFLVYEENLKELLRFCPNCGALVIPENTVEVNNEGSQLSLKLNCMDNCTYKWQSQPTLCDVKGAGNLLLTCGIFFSGIPFAKFQSFAKLTNLKFIGKGTFFNLREQYVFPVVKTAWKDQQEKVFDEIKLNESGAVLAGDGRCDSPGHSAKYCTYTFLDTVSQKVVDFKVVSVTEVANSNRMEKKGFVDTLQNIEANGIKVDVISTDRHSQITKEMRVNHGDIDNQFDPWHLAKSVSKKLSAASKKSGCSDLAPWISSIINHLWWCAESCNKDPEVLCEKWSSVIHHVTNRHEWPGNKHFHKCEHDKLSAAQQRKKKWLKPGSAAHTALVNIVKDKGLLKDLKHLVQFVHTTALEVYHSLYLKYLPKLTHFSHDVMIVGTMLPALDHNFNVNRPQALIQTGESQGEPRFKISWSKVSKRFSAEPVLEKKSYHYLEDMLEAAFHLAVLGVKPAPRVKDTKYNGSSRKARQRRDY